MTREKDDKIRSQQQWESGFDGHSDAQLIRMSKLSFREKIQWLEDMQIIIEQMKRSDNK